MAKSTQSASVEADLYSGLDSFAPLGLLVNLTMTDAWERKDAVLGHDKGYVYPSSLLYLVSGMFEELDAKAYPDAPILGMQRFAGLADLSAVEAAAASKIATFFQRPDHGIISSPTAGVSMCGTHGGFDDEPLTLATAQALF